jgi:hypothetical protein
MKVKTPREWTDEEFKQVHQLLDHPGWKLFENYARMRIERHRDKVIDHVGKGDDESKILVGRIKEAEELLAPIYRRLKKHSKKRAKQNKEINK